VGLAVGLLTGTFDPVHLGHLEMSRAAMKSCGLDEVWLHVNARSAHKDGVTEYALRMAMVRLALEGEPRIRPYIGDLAEEPHTQPTFRRLARTYPGTRFLFIVGMDTLAWLDRWDDVASVVEHSTFAVAHRPGTPVQELDSLRERLGSLGDRLQVQLFDFDDHGLASSTAIRRQLRAGERPQALDPRVLDYIRDYHLYS
jgi:nicotinate-nucleotide adenylyltransferase